MTKKKEAATGEGAATFSNTFFQDHSNSAACQRQFLLAWLRTYGSINTIQARRELDILAPAARIFELRRKGFDIVTAWENMEGHKIGRYVLMSEVGTHE
jgi:hypothetical protein